MLQFLWSLGAFVVALGILITVHEYGHFWVARRCGVKVERFSIGFGKTLLRRIGKDGTEYTLALIPLGGYVKMLDGRVDEVPASMQSQAFNAKTVWQRIAIVAAGPLANFAFAILAFYLMFLIGVPTVRPVIGEVAPQSIAAEAQIAPTSVITRVGDRATVDWEAVNLALVEYIGNDELSLTVEDGNSGRSRTVELDLRDWQVQPDKEPLFVSLGMMPWRPAISNELALVTEEGAAFEAGVRVGDKLMAINGEPYRDWPQLVSLVEANAGTPVVLTLQRQFNSLEITVVPRGEPGADGKLVGKIGVSPLAEPWPEAYRIDLSYGVLDSVMPALQRTGQLVELTVKTIGKLFTGDLAVSNLSGPISIAQGAGSSAGYGLVYFLGFLALISVNLGIINLLPLPVLDGGHLLYFAVEVLTGKPVPERIQDFGYRIGSALVLMLMIIAIVNDVARL
ncbi:site-2 protease. Metallo peptidase. MEROPS family M50B [Ferrimonas sediminum]|uniref:Zinc metalloprotease n=1 Tax=Ferrimonas sediminum TaxID=718193 RepID=A0A1G8LL49_9GAMM|nr:sigma E protease regulator RseP [Ferrimonas sediminum]SDI56414.1 site-2 protease. Metallo peptidase. MEROPS family M50B [Ferrimonas sediminum]